MMHLHCALQTSNDAHLQSVTCVGSKTQIKPIFCPCTNQIMAGSPSSPYRILCSILETQFLTMCSEYSLIMIRVPFCYIAFVCSRVRDVYVRLYLPHHRISTTCWTTIHRHMEKGKQTIQHN